LGAETRRTIVPANKSKPAKAKKTRDPKDAQAYDHEEKLLLRPDVGLQPQFKRKKPPKTYRYDPSLDPALSWDGSADRERAEALIARIEQATDLTETKAAAAELRRMSRPFLNWTGKAERHELTVPTLPLFVHERLSTQAILQSVKSHKRDRQQTLALFADEELDVTDRLLRAYEYQTDWVNRLILGDSLVVMNSLLQYEGLGGQVHMIYMDPPHGRAAMSGGGASVRGSRHRDTAPADGPWATSATPSVVAFELLRHKLEVHLVVSPS
jgi:adenine-specific DNA-methyltransferase